MESDRAFKCVYGLIEVSRVCNYDIVSEIKVIFCSFLTMGVGFGIRLRLEVGRGFD